MTVFLVTLLAFSISMAAMAIGVALFSKPPLVNGCRASCGTGCGNCPGRRGAARPEPRP